MDVVTIAGILTVPGLEEEKIRAAVEDTPAAFSISDFAKFVISAIDELDDLLELEVDQCISRQKSINEPHVFDEQQALYDDAFGDVSKENSNVLSNLPGP